jgi:predicted PurR-regulated permease PerM
MLHMQDSRSPDLARTIFQFLALGCLIAASFWILQPFLISLVWAATVAIATWPLLLRAQWITRRQARSGCSRDDSGDAADFGSANLLRRQ